MRFAISLLTLICIASIIGTVLRQHEPASNYVNQFGPFWADVFLKLGLNAVYGAWWFLLILAFLVTSTLLCIARNAPRFLADLRSCKENIREQSLQAFHHKATATVAQTPQAAARRMGEMLVASGWKVRLQERTQPGGTTAVMLAARAGAANKLGYIAAHSAIVLICLGGLLDGDLVVRAQTWLGGKSVYRGSGLISEVPPEHWLAQGNPTFRGNLFVPEGAISSTAVLSQSDGVLLQDLPFAIELKKFIVEYYDSGMPRLFASEVTLHDRATGQQVDKRIEVNHPARFKGIEIYQSSFDDGGSSVTVQALPMQEPSPSFDLQGVIGGKSEITNGQNKLTVEYTGLRVINVENMAAGGDPADSDAATAAGAHGGGNWMDRLEKRLGAADKPAVARKLVNVGPSLGYKLRDAAGQAREYHNYMRPVADEEGGGALVFLMGVRDTPAEPFRYLRIPADEAGSLQGFFALRDALRNPDLRARAISRYVAQVTEPDQKELAEQLSASTARVLDLFAGEASTAQGQETGGLQAVSNFIETTVPPTERERATGVLLRILGGALYQLDALAREGAGRPPLGEDAASARYLNLAVLALSDIHFYPAPVALQLKDFKQVQASVFQVARAPGKNAVYLGCALLVLGVFAMLYVRDRRLWIWLTACGGGQGAPATAAQESLAVMAMSTNRKMLDADQQFDVLKRRLLGPAAESNAP
ncbi:MAG: cytochrome c biogenesis protein ResB [Burkholderiaceae bacterium]|nr:cytochrome c biogenesis protein ResB [Burkholderiaceae bacterium]